MHDVRQRSYGPRKIVGMLGVHFAITADQERALLAADDEDDSETVSDLLEEIEENWAGRAVIFTAT